MSIPLLCGPSVLVPVHVCVSHDGVKFVDSFLWKLDDPLLSPEAFVAHLCADLGLPYAFQIRIVLQLSEQVAAYREIISAVKSHISHSDSALKRLSKFITINIHASYGAIDYKDTFQWNILSVVSPEAFARSTCGDLGLPCELETIIAIQIREAVIKHIIEVIQGKDEAEEAKDATPSDVKVSMLLPGAAVDKVTSFWKENRAIESLVMQPEDKRTNAAICNNM